MIICPPVKAWTSILGVRGERYFVSTNYGSIKEKYWINMVSIIDGRISFGLDLKELSDDSLWIPGWIDLDELSKITISRNKKTSHTSINKKFSNNACLHPSIDSGLLIPLLDDNIRPWFPP